MFKIFLVEDEVGIRESIRDTLDWEAAGLEYSGDAPDGEMALKAIRKLRPDIVITDIRMPFMDGLELVALSREELPETRFIILSGHDDFTYAQKAIRLGVVEYLLKPVSPSELMRAVNRAVVDLRCSLSDMGGSGDHDLGTGRARRDAFLRDLLAGGIAPSGIFEGITRLGIPLRDNFCLAALAKLNTREVDLARDAAMGTLICREAATRHAVELEKGRGEFIVIFQGESAREAEETALSSLKWVMEECRGRHGAVLACGIGNATERLHELGRSLREAEIACNYSLFVVSVSPCLFSGMSGSTHHPGLGLAELLDRGRDFLQCAGSAEIPGFAAGIRRAATEAGGGVALQYAYIDIVMTAAKVIEAMGDNPEVALPEFSRFGEGAFGVCSPENLEAAVTSICGQVIGRRQKNFASRHSGMLGRAKRFIEENYADPNLSLQKIAEHVHVSPAHFSAVFSRETGETFSDCLSRIRIANAMRLMKSTSSSAAEISEKVGYNDPQYFSRAFKRAAGMSIRSFRRGGAVDGTIG